MLGYHRLVQFCAESQHIGINILRREPPAPQIIDPKDMFSREPHIYIYSHPNWFTFHLVNTKETKVSVQSTLGFLRIIHVCIPPPTEPVHLNDFGCHRGYIGNRFQDTMVLDLDKFHIEWDRGRWGYC
jgi:hypothetical protein